MWSCRLIFLISLVGIAATSGAWKAGTAYKYHLAGRTLTTVLQAEESFAGIAVQGQVELRLTSRNVLSAKILHMKYASLHLKLPGGWNAPIPESSLDYKTLPISRQPFEIKLKDGLIDGLVVSGDIPKWELNILKAIVSLLQVDTEGKDLIRDSYNYRPNHTAASPNAVYRKMEDSITGKCEVLYDLAPLPPYLVQAQPQLAPLVMNIADTPITEILKTQNYSNCDRRVSYTFGFPGISEFEHPDDNQAGEFLARSSVSRIIISGPLQRYTIQSSVTTNKVILSPILYNKQKVMVVGSLNLTLASLKSTSGQPQSIPNRKDEDSLAYSYENVFNYERDSSESVQFDASRSLSSSSKQHSSEELHNSRSISSKSREDSLSASLSNPESNESPSASDYSRNQNWASSESHFGGDRIRRSAYMADESSYRSNQQSSQESSYESPISSRQSNEKASKSSSESRSAESNADSSSGSYYQSSEENKYYIPLPSLGKAPSLPMMPLFTGLSGKSIAHKINVAETVRKISVEISRDIVDQNAMAKLNSLSKFAILTEIVRTMSLKQLQTSMSSLYVSPSSLTSSESESQRLRLTSWVVFRDAVAVAGTTPALMAIKEWILAHKVVGEEAAELVAVLPSSAITPTPEYLKELFKLASSSEVKQQPFLNDTAILSFTNLIRTSQIDNATAHKFYPVHVFGRIAAQSDPAIYREYLPYLQQSLKEAISHNNSVKAQVYIRAIGNIAHPKILEIFEPYLEKVKYASNFQRTLMVVSLNQLAKVYPEVARNVLFKIYQSTAESHELRCAAVFLLFSTNPSPAMLQRMAEFTNYETHMQVNAAVISGVQSLAGLKISSSPELVRAAKSALNMLNTTSFPKQFTSTNIRDYVSEHLALAYSQTLNYIGSDDTIIPKAVFYNVTRNVGGFKHSHFSLGGMTSSVDSLIEAFKSLVGSDEPNTGSYERKLSNKWAPSKLRDIINLKPSLIDPLEGNVMIKFAGITRYLAFDESLIEKLPEVAQGILSALRTERSFNFTKFYNQFPVRLAFPMATGLPFVYSLKTPSVISVGGKAHVKTQPDIFRDSRNGPSVPQIVNVTSAVEILMSSKIVSNAGFYTAFDAKHYIAGVVKNSLINLPFRAKLDMDVEKLGVSFSVEPLNKNEKVSVAHYSSEPYIVRHDILNLKPLQEESDYEPLEVKHYPSQYQKVFGEQSSGMAFSVEYESSQKYNGKSKILEDAKKDPLMLLYYPWAEDQLKYENASITYIPQLSSTNSVTVKLSLASKSKEFASSDAPMEVFMDGKSHPRHKKSTRRSRQESSENESFLKIGRASSQQERMLELLDQADIDVKGKSAVAVDVCAQFEGENKAEFVATAALTQSQIEQYTNVLLSVYAKPVAESQRPLHVFLNVSSYAPYVPLLNFKEALEAKPFASLNASLYFGDANSETGFIIAQAKFNQSKERQAFVRQHPMAQLCESQMSEGNNALPACRNVTAEANYMDQLALLVDYNNIPIAAKNASYKLYDLVHYLAWPYFEENVFVENPPQNQLKAYWKLSQDLQQLNVSLETPVGTAAMYELPLGPIVGPLLAVHPVYSIEERFSKVLLGDQLSAKCSVSASAVNTFDNNTYPIHLGKCWHALTLIAPKQRPHLHHNFHYQPILNEDNDVAVLIRDADSPQKKEVKIIVGPNVIDVSPSSLAYSEEENSGISSAKIRVNERTLKVSSSNITEIYNEKGDVWVQIYFMAPSELKLKFPLHGIKMLYDGESLQLSANDTFRDNVKGLCGTFNGEPITDFVAPNGNYLNDTQLFAAIYSIPEECQGPAASLRRKAWQKAVFSVHEAGSGGNVIDMLDILGGVSLSSSSSSSSSESLENQDPKNNSPFRPRGPSQSLGVLHTAVFDEGSDLCFTLYPVMKCSYNSHPSSRTEKSVPVYCLPRKNPTAKKLKTMIDSGLNPDLRRKGATKYMKVSLPKSCVKN